MKIPSPRTSGVSVVIPVHNNGIAIIPRLVACENMLSALQVPYELVIGEDASTDGSAQALRDHFSGRSHVRIFYHPHNLGIGKNIYFLYTKARYPYTALFSVDGDWNIDDLKRMIHYCWKQHADMVIGKRLKKSGYTWDRRMISFLFNTLPKLFFGVDPIDAGSIKVFKTSLMRTIPVISRSQFFEAELIIKAINAGKIVYSLPVSYRKRVIGRGMWWRLGGAVEAFVDLLRVYWVSRIADNRRPRGDIAGNHRAGAHDGVFSNHNRKYRRV